ncbi:hypothetical protein EMCRGX_G009613 [Ephydatia muelleri]
MTASTLEYNNVTEKTPLHCAAISENAEVVNALLKAGSKVDEKDETEKTPLHCAAISGNAEVVNALLKAGSKVDEKDETEKTPLHCAAISGNAEVVNALLKAGSKVDEKDESIPTTSSPQTVLDSLISKHPPGQPVIPWSVIHPSEDPPQVLPVHLELMLLAGKDSAPLFTLNQTDLCHSLALLARKLCTVFLDPKGLSPFLACRLIPLNKNPGVRPIVICETSRIVAKAVLSVTRQDIQQAAGSLQLCAGQVAGIDAAIHTMSHLFNDDVNDATATGKITNLCTWWDKLVSLGPAYGYHVNASKTCLVAKQSHHAAALSAFHDTQITITAEGKPHLGAALGTFTFVQHYVKRKVEGWAQELNQLASIAANNPHAAYAAFTHGLSSRWIFLARAIPNIRHLMQPLEDIIRSKLIPNLTGRSAPFDTERELYSLPARLGGMGLINPSTLSQSEFHSSSLISQPLVSNILSHNYDYNEETLTEQQKSIKEVVKMKLNRNNTAATQLRAMLPSNLQLAMDLCQEKGASSWRTVLPIEEYAWLPANTPTSCACGAPFSVEHALSCPKGGFPSIRHNEIRDYTAYLLSEICHNVSTEPHLQPITGEAPTSASANFQDGARLDVAADGFWGSRFERTFFDVKVFNPYAPSNRRPQPSPVTVPMRPQETSL